MAQKLFDSLLDARDLAQIAVNQFDVYLEDWRDDFTQSELEKMSFNIKVSAGWLLDAHEHAKRTWAGDASTSTTRRAANGELGSERVATGGCATAIPEINQKYTHFMRL